MSKSIAKYRAVFFFTLLIALLFFFGYLNHCVTQAQFNVDALGRYIRANYLVTGQRISRLSQLPDVCLVSPDDGLEFCTENIRLRIFRGYYYDATFLDEKRFVISASPVMFNDFMPEFGMVEDMNLRINNTNRADPDADSHEEVGQWPVLTVWYNLVTKAAM